MKKKRPWSVLILLNLYLISELCTSCFKALPVGIKVGEELPEYDVTIRPPRSVGNDCYGYPCPIYKVLRDKMRELEKALSGSNAHRNDSLERLAIDGDILLTPSQIDNFILQQRVKGHRKKRQIQATMESRWTFPIKYRIDETFNSTTADNVRRAVVLWEAATCIQFQEIRSQFDIPPNKQQYVVFMLFGTSCASYIGLNDFLYPQPVFVSAVCAMSVGALAHELGHVIGFWHEHQRSDRDMYVKIHGENMGSAYDPWQLLPTGDTRNIQPYDYTSLMHYSYNAFAFNSSLMTIEPFNHLYIGSMGQKFGITFLGAAAANYEYCRDACRGILLLRPCQNRGYQDPKNCNRCRCPDGYSGEYCEFLTPSSAGCGGTITLSPGQTLTISSPGYNNNLPYSEGTTCTWLIKTRDGDGITFDLSGFDFGMYCESKLCYHWLEVRSSIDLTIPGLRYCCTKQMDRIYIDQAKQVSQTNQMMILFRSDNRVPQYPAWGRRGFKAKISSSAPSVARKADIALIVEASESVGPYNWNLTKRFLRELVNQYTVGPDDCLFAFITYSGVANIELNFNSNSGRQTLLNAIEASPFQAGASNTAGGIYEAGRAFDSMGSRKNVPRLVILVNDGVSDIRKDELISAAQQIRLGPTNADILAIGVTNRVKMQQFINITGSADFVLTVPRFENLTTLLTSIQKVVKSSMEKGGEDVEYHEDPTSTFSCDFEDDNKPFCDMAHSSVGVFKWTRWRGSTPSELTGPTSAASGDWYIYIEASSPRIPGDYAIIYSPIIQISGDYCLRFYYHMYGYHIYQLRVSVANNLKWMAQGQKGDYWLSANIDLNLRAYDRIQFLGMVGFGYSGDIAVDNINLTAGVCMRAS